MYHEASLSILDTASLSATLVSGEISRSLTHMTGYLRLYAHLCPCAFMVVLTDFLNKDPMVGQMISSVEFVCVDAKYALVAEVMAMSR